MSKQPWKGSSAYIVKPSNNPMVPPQYSAPPPPLHSISSYQQCSMVTANMARSTYNSATGHAMYGSGGASSSVSGVVHQPQHYHHPMHTNCQTASESPASSVLNLNGIIDGSHHKSMWAINPLYASNSGESP